MAGRTFAAIVIGSTETEMKVFEFETRKGIREIDWVSRRLNLGLDAYTLGRISQENINDLCETLRDFKRIMEGYKAENYRVCATQRFPGFPQHVDYPGLYRKTDRADDRSDQQFGTALF